MQELEGFQYATTLDLKMGYYTINILSTTQELLMIVTEFGKFRYIYIPMGMCALGDIFQATVDNPISDIKGSKTYIDNILLLSKD